MFTSRAGLRNGLGLVLQDHVSKLGEAARIHFPIVGSKRVFAIANLLMETIDRRNGYAVAGRIYEEVNHLGQIRATYSLDLKKAGFLE